MLYNLSFSFGDVKKASLNHHLYHFINKAFNCSTTTVHQPMLQLLPKPNVERNSFFLSHFLFLLRALLTTDQHNWECKVDAFFFTI